MVRYLQTIYGIESCSVRDSILEFPNVHNQITAKLDRNEKQKMLQKLFTGGLVLKISLFHVLLQHFRRLLVGYTIG